MVIVVVVVTKTQHKTQLLASVYHTFLLVKVVIFLIRKGKSKNVIDATSAVQMWNATIVADNLSYILMSSAGFEDENSRSYNKFTKP